MMVAGFDDDEQIQRVDTPEPVPWRGRQRCGVGIDNMRTRICTSPHTGAGVAGL
jgi:hypothetical protein